MTKIEWTDVTWNPVTGCTKVSAGCKNCYAERHAGRRMNPEWADRAANLVPDPKSTHETGLRLREFTDVWVHPERLDAPLHWRKPRRVFVNSMSDLFHEDVPDEFIERVFAVMALAPRHTFQILTKRPARMLSWFTTLGGMETRKECVERCVENRTGKLIERIAWPFPNVWLGVSVENQGTADERIPLLLQTPAAVRFVSYEPALSAVDFEAVKVGCGWRAIHCACSGPEVMAGGKCPLHPTLDWIIVGGESGPGARPFDIAWARSTIAQCRAAGVPVFVKQLGSRPVGEWPGRGPLHPDADCWRLRDCKGGDMAEWPDDLRARDFPTTEGV